MSDARNRDELLEVEPAAHEIHEKYIQGLKDPDARELAIHRRLSKVNY